MVSWWMVDGGHWPLVGLKVQVVKRRRFRFMDAPLKVSSVKIWQAFRPVCGNYRVKFKSKLNCNRTRIDWIAKREFFPSLAFIKLDFSSLFLLNEIFIEPLNIILIAVSRVNG